MSGIGQIMGRISRLLQIIYSVTLSVSNFVTSFKMDYVGVKQDIKTAQTDVFNEKK